jgi:hypothetical protein
MDRGRAAELAGLDPAEVFAVVERGGRVVVIDVTGRKHAFTLVTADEPPAFGEPDGETVTGSGPDDGSQTTHETVVAQAKQLPRRRRGGGR